MRLDPQKDKKILEEIKGLLSGLQSAEDTDPYYMDADLKELRNKVMYVHLRIEASLEIIIGDLLLEPFAKYKVKNENKQLFRFYLGNTIEAMDYVKKLTVLQEAGRLQKSTTNKFHKVNYLRIRFSH